jgi:transcriptional regulator of acetoin/glycerol metabolism
MTSSRLDPRRFHRFLHQGARAFYALDAEGAFLYGNDAFAEWIGQDLAAAVGRSCRYGVYPLEPEAASNEAAVPQETPLDKTLRGIAVSGDVAARMQAETLVWCEHPQRGERLRRGRTLRLADDAGAAVTAVFLDERDLPFDQALEALAVRTDEPESAARGRILTLRAFRSRLSVGWNLPLLGSLPEVVALRSRAEALARTTSPLCAVGPSGSFRERLVRGLAASELEGEAATVYPFACALLDEESLLDSLREAMSMRPLPDGLAFLEIDRLDAACQSALEQTLPDLQRDVRILSTATVSPIELARQGSFRPLLAALAAPTELKTVPLAKRTRDFALLAQYVIEQWNVETGASLARIDDATLEWLRSYSWPGDLQEWQDALRDACSRCDGPALARKDFSRDARSFFDAKSREAPPEEPIDLDAYLARIERELMRRAMKKARGNKTKAAELLGIHRARLIRRWAALSEGETKSES